MKCSISLGIAQTFRAGDLWWRWLIYHAKAPHCFTGNGFNWSDWAQLNRDIDLYVLALLNEFGDHTGTYEPVPCDPAVPPYWECEIDDRITDTELDEFITRKLREKGAAIYCQ
jgi:hypothetical protein